MLFRAPDRQSSIADTLIDAVLLSRSHFAVVVWRAGIAGEMESSWLQCGLNKTQITCGRAGHGLPRKGRILDMYLTAVERDRLAMVCSVEGGEADSQAGGRPGDGTAESEQEGGWHLDLTIWEGVGGGDLNEAALTLEQRGTWRMPAVAPRDGPRVGRSLRSKLHAAVLTPSKLVVAWAGEGGAVDTVVAFAQGDWSTVSWSPVVRVLEAQKSSARQRTLATSENELTDQEAADAQGNEGQIQGLWACDGGLPDALAIVVLRAHGRPNPRPPDRGGGGAVGFGNVMWQIQLKVDSVHAPASAASDARGGTGLHVIGGKVRLWDDVPPSGLSTSTSACVYVYSGFCLRLLVLLSMSTSACRWRLSQRICLSPET